MCNFREEEITHNFFGCFFVARNPAVLILFEKQIIILILSSFWSRTYRGVKLFLFEKEREIEIKSLQSLTFEHPHEDAVIIFRKSQVIGHIIAGFVIRGDGGRGGGQNMSLQNPFLDM
jgi:hypothetical protein